MFRASENAARADSSWLGLGGAGSGACTSGATIPANGRRAKDGAVDAVAVGGVAGAAGLAVRKERIGGIAAKIDDAAQTSSRR
ncbi:hypothetical protein NPX13_g9727 [Xylaria arbuscula]|uniref:Uncharacterized protein n=1 Tax=Xylaria arbuscula TaxID=114810 RepID=A0A9W8THF4_9PEZI|nr:hypothetical protein NPX13_g9727 [Xylaria arbuscula]